jgi:hypothetical protein
MIKFILLLSLLILTGCNNDALYRAKIIEKMTPERIKEALLICSYNLYICECTILDYGKRNES